MHQPVNTGWSSYHLIGPKLPLKLKEIWAVRIRLQMANKVRDLALFDLGLDSKLRGCDLVKLRIGDVTIGRSIRSRCMVVQQKTGRPVQFEITAAIWPPCRRVGRDDRPRSGQLWHPQHAAHQGGAHLQEDGQPSCLPATARTQQA
jgi:hypothetical protein